VREERGNYLTLRCGTCFGGSFRFPFIIMACELYACIFGFGLGWAALFLRYLLLFFGCEGIWYDESLLGGMAMRVEVMTYREVER
jgi:hypothetical protein